MTLQVERRQNSPAIRPSLGGLHRAVTSKQWTSSVSLDVTNDRTRPSVAGCEEEVTAPCAIVISWTVSVYDVIPMRTQNRGSRWGRTRYAKDVLFLVSVDVSISWRARDCKYGAGGVTCWRGRGTASWFYDLNTRTNHAGRLRNGRNIFELGYSPTGSL
jgi:hypothetical protein